MASLSKKRTITIFVLVFFILSCVSVSAFGKITGDGHGQINFLINSPRKFYLSSGASSCFGMAVGLVLCCPKASSATLLIGISGNISLGSLRLLAL